MATIDTSPSGPKSSTPTRKKNILWLGEPGTENLIFSKPIVTFGDSSAKVTNLSVEFCYTQTVPNSGCNAECTYLLRFIDRIGRDLPGHNEQDLSSALDCLSMPIHCICVLITSSDTLKTHSFISFLTLLFANLPKDAHQNVLFCFNFSPRSDFTEKDGLTALAQILPKEFDASKLENLACFVIEPAVHHNAIRQTPSLSINQSEGMSMISKIVTMEEIRFELAPSVNKNSIQIKGESFINL